MRRSAERAGLSGVHSLYFFCYMAWGALLPFLNLHFRQLGMSGIQIGSLSALMVFVGATGSLFWSGIADVFLLHRALFLCAMAMTTGAVVMLAGAAHYPAIALWAAIYAFLGSPLSPLLDSAAVGTAREDRGGFGTVRVWGTVGWALATLLTGVLVRHWDMGWSFYGYILFMGIAFLLAFWKVPLGRSRSSGGRWAIFKVLRQPRFIVFLGSVFLLGTTLGAGSNFLSLYMEDLGANVAFIGLAWTVGATAEIPMMLGSRYLVRCLGARGLLVLAFLAFSVRWFLFSFVSSPGEALVIQVLHGFSFAAFLVGGVLVTTSFAPPGLSTVTLATFNAVAFGASSIVGALVGGYVYDTIGLRALFRVLGAVSLAGLAVLVVFGQCWKGKTSPRGG